VSASARLQSALHTLKHGACTRLLPSDLAVADSCKLTNGLYGLRGLQAHGLSWYWQTSPRCEARDWITLAAHDARLQIGLHGDPIGCDTRPLDWRAYADETRLLAWTACHEPLIELLRAVFQRDWTPEKITDSSQSGAPLDAGRLRAAFRVSRADGLTVVTGIADFPAQWASVLAARCEFSQPRPRLPIHARLPVVIDELEIAPTEIAHLERGCIVRLDNKLLMTPRPRVALRIGQLSWIAELGGVRATVLGFAATHSGEHDMNTAADIVSLPVRLTFSAGRVILPFGTLSDVGPGYVFELDKQLDDQVITVHANETPIAVGELVAIGDMVGVRITRMLLKA
jgi:hypothetical protein